VKAGASVREVDADALADGDGEAVADALDDAEDEAVGRAD